MLVRKLVPAQGICFAWWPTWTPDGLVWLEFVHYKFIDTEFGGWDFRRMVPQDRYDAGERVSHG